MSHFQVKCVWCGAVRGFKAMTRFYGRHFCIKDGCLNQWRDSRREYNRHWISRQGSSKDGLPIVVSDKTAILDKT